MEDFARPTLSNEFSESDSEYGDHDDYDGEHEYAVKSFTKVVDGEVRREVNFRIFKSKEEDFEEWLEIIQVRCTANGKDIGSALGRYIHRQRIKQTFWQSMEEVSHYMSNLAFETFDRYGYLKKGLKEHPVQRGTGVWGNEMDLGPLFFIEHVEVTDREWRRMGLGRTMVNSLIEKASTTESYVPLQHVLVAPGWLRSDVEPEKAGKSASEQREIIYRAVDSAVGFYRSLGFRRILTISPMSHAIAIEDDFDPPTEPLEDGSHCEDGPEAFANHQELESRRLLKLKEKLPLHHAALTMPDAECVEYYKTFTTNDVSEWARVNHRKETLLHVAASQLKPKSLQWLMEESGLGENLALARNISGYTPLEALQDQLETRRTQADQMGMKIDISDQFRGFSPLALSCLSSLLRMDLQSLTSAQLLRLKYGCTCGDCLGGFISPRMKTLLIDRAEITYDGLGDSLQDASERHFDVLRYARYTTPELQQIFHISRSVWEDYIDIFTHIALSLGSDKVPISENVLATLPTSNKYLRLNGTSEGKIEPVLQILLEEVKAGSKKAGNGALEGEFGDTLEELKECRNDYEFGVMALGCGLRPRSTFP